MKELFLGTLWCFWGSQEKSADSQCLFGEDYFEELKFRRSQGISASFQGFRGSQGSQEDYGDFHVHFRVSQEYLRTIQRVSGALKDN